jgi:alkaline phosphatase D
MSDERPSSAPESNHRRVSRRGFLVGATGLGTATALSVGAFVTETGEVSADPWVRDEQERATLTPSQSPSKRHWLGPELWGNRLQDWRNVEGRVECLRGAAGYELRTVALLTREIVTGNRPGHLRVRTGIAESGDGAGFSGLLLGVGNGDLDHRAAALVGRSSGTGGGTLCTFETDGRVRFRDHTDEANPVAYEQLSADDRRDGETAGKWDGDSAVTLSVDLLPQDDGRFAIHLKAFAADGRGLVSEAVRRNVPESELLGGVAFVSSPAAGSDGPRWWFDRIETSGEKVATRPEHTFGPIAGTLYSLDDSVLKLTAQLLPVGEADPETVRLRYRPVEVTESDSENGPENRPKTGRSTAETSATETSTAETSATESNSETDPKTDGGGTPTETTDTVTDSDSSWRTATASLEAGYTALFRVEDWDSSRSWDYRVEYRDATDERWSYEGRVRADPGDAGEVTVGLLSCTSTSTRGLDRTDSPEHYARKSVPGRYAPENLFVPYETLTENLGSYGLDLFVSVGDQFYENRPTSVPDRENPRLDYLYKWSLWHWSFRDLTRDTPTVVLADDHDVYQPKIWGSGGDKTSMGNLYEGGYVGSAAFVNLVQRTQCGHNPDPYDPTPTERGIDVYYGEFTYGDTRFAMLEDRKFKTGPNERNDVPREEITLLGDRQEQFLADWADGGDDSTPSVCLTQTSFACPLTVENGQPASNGEDFDMAFETNGYPKKGRDRAVELLGEAGALVLGGDLHLPLLLRHGLDEYTDGIVQFVGPAGGATYPRWFAPSDSLPNGRGHPHTGQFTDTFGNDLRILAVDNPELSYKAAQRPRKGPFVLDRDRSTDGYGVVRIDHDEETFVVECWPWNADPTAGDDAQYTGWPYRLPFDETVRE